MREIPLIRDLPLNFCLRISAPIKPPINWKETTPITHIKEFFKAIKNTLSFNILKKFSKPTYFDSKGLRGLKS